MRGVVGRVNLVVGPRRGRPPPSHSPQEGTPQGSEGQQPNRGRQDIDDTEMQDRMDHDYDA